MPFCIKFFYYCNYI